MLEYWATKAKTDLCSELMKKIDEYYSYTQSSGIFSRWKRAHRAYYGKSQSSNHDTTQVGIDGEQGELSVLKVNNLRNLGQHLHTLITSQRPALETRSVNTDLESQEQSILAVGVLEYYMREKNLENKLRITAEKTLLYAEAFLQIAWNATTGEQYGVHPETGAVVYNGDLEFKSFGPLDVIRDIHAFDNETSPWRIVREFKNKFDLAAKYPELAEKILGIDAEIQQNRTFRTVKQGSNDLIPQYTFYHAKTDALPTGRMTAILDDGICLIDGPLPYRDIPLYRCAPSDEFETPFGYTVLYDLLGLQQASDALYSCALTSLKNFGISNVLAPKGGDISVQQLQEGLNLIEYDPKLGPITTLNLTSIPPALFEFIKILGDSQQTLSGISSVTRGNVESSLSGSALALVASQSISFASGVQQSYYSLIEQVGTAAINVLHDYAKTPRIAMIAGKSNRAKQKTYSGDDFANINRVSVEIVNPVSKTYAGRLTLAQDLLKSGLIKRPEEYISVVTTGRLEPLYENEQASLLMIRAENEQLMAGELPAAILTDDHRLHILEHKVVLDSPEARTNPELVQRAIIHLQQHLDILRTADPALLQMLGQQPIAPLMLPGTPGVMNATDPMTQQAENVNMPRMPTNPLTGDQFNNQTGGV